MNNWKLVSAPIAFLDCTGRRVWISSEDKKQRKAVEKLARKSCSNVEELSMTSSEVVISLGSEFDVELLAEDFEGFHLQNLSKEWLGLLMGECSFAKGQPIDLNKSGDDIFDVNFEFTMNPNNPEEVGLVTEDMDEYEECFNEMIRQANCSSLRKTKSWKPGHRYDTENETLFFLGEFGSHKESIYSDYVPLSAGKKAYLVTKSIKGCKTISDVFKTKTFGPEGIQVRYSISPMVDSGEQLVYDTKDEDISKYWDTMIDNTTGIVDLLDILAYTNNNPSPAPEKLKKLLAERVISPAKSLTIRYWDTEGVTNELMEIGSKKDGKSNRTGLMNLIWKEVGDNNHLAPLYYTDLFLAYEINLDEVLNEILEEYGSSKKVFSSWNNYVERGIEYFKLHDLDISRKRSNQRDKSLTGYYYSSKPKIETLNDIYGGGDLVNALKSFFSESISNEGLPATEIAKYNMGTKKSRNEYYCVSAEFSDFVRWAEEKSILTEDLKEEIISKKWRGTELEIDTERELK